MVTYEQIFEAFYKYAASREQGAYNELWIMCWQRMTMLCLSRYGAGSDPEDIDDIVNNATLHALAKITTADDVTVEFISKTFYWSMLGEAANLFRKKTNRVKIMRKYISDVENAAKIYFQR